MKIKLIYSKGGEEEEIEKNWEEHIIYNIIKEKWHWECIQIYSRKITQFYYLFYLVIGFRVDALRIVTIAWIRNSCLWFLKRKLENK